MHDALYLILQKDKSEPLFALQYQLEIVYKKGPPIALLGKVCSKVNKRILAVGYIHTNTHGS